MTEVFKSCFNYKIYIKNLQTLLLLPVLIGGYLKLKEDITNGYLTTNVGVTIIILILVIAFFIYSIHFYISKSPKVEIDARGIRIGNHDIDLLEIESINLRSINKSYYFIIPYDHIETSSITLKSGKEINLFVDHYGNGSLLRENLNRVDNFLKGKTDSFTVSNTINKEEQTGKQYWDEFQEYRQPPYKFSTYYTSFPLIAIFIYVGIKISFLDYFNLILFGLAFMVYLLLVNQSHYYLISDNCLIVKNYLFPGWKKVFLIKNIYEVTTEQQLKQEVALKVITKNFRVFRYQSGLLSPSMFENLIKEIKANQILLLGKASYATA